jgi:branched-chain amino acid transport system ATP-binding protein
MTASLLEVAGVRAGYGVTTVLDGVDLRVPAGSVVALLGANGVGKTTLLRTVAGLVAPSAGTITFQGRRIDGRPAYKVARLGLGQVPEGRGIFPGLTVAENLRLASFTRRGAARPDATVDGRELFPILAERIDQPGGTLSGGEQQMLAVARALATAPSLLLLDEPSLGMAPRVVQDLFAALGRIRDTGVAMLIAEQAAHQAVALADYVYVLGSGGKVVSHGPADSYSDSSAIYQSYMT